MSLHTKKVTADFKDIKLLKQINDEAFPEEEHIPVEELLQMVHDKKLEIHAVYDLDCLVGFFVIVLYRPVAYVFFLAMDPNQRSKGYGSRTLALMKEKFPEYQIVLDIENIDETADNIEQRRSRKQFYLRNGFNETDYNLDLNGMEMEVLCNSKQLDAAAFSTLLDRIECKRAVMSIFPKKQKRLVPGMI